MNPNVVIKTWLVVCGRYFGAVEAYEDRRSDAKARSESRYFEYSLASGLPVAEDCILKNDSLSGSYDVIESGSQEWIVNVEIDLYNDNAGFDDLAGCAIAARGQSFRNFFKSNLNNAAFKRVVSLETIKDRHTDDRKYYHHRMVCEFVTMLGYRHEHNNEVITSVITDDMYDLT